MQLAPVDVIFAATALIMPSFARKLFSVLQATLWASRAAESFMNLFWSGGEGREWLSGVTEA